MVFKIYYTIDNFEDYVFIRGDNIKDIRKKIKRFFKLRGTTAKKTNAWSETIEN